MRFACAAIAAVVAACIAAAAAAVSPNVRISQVYGGGSNANAAYDVDFVELFNFSDYPVAIGGWSLQYGSATGTTGLGVCEDCTVVLPPGAVIESCGYYLVAMEPGPVGAPLPVAADATGAMNLSGASGKLGLVRSGAPLGACAGALLVDLVGYGTANCQEYQNAGGLSPTTAAVRRDGGLIDTDNNSLDFDVSAPAPRGRASPFNGRCLIVDESSLSWGALKATYR